MLIVQCSVNGNMYTCSYSSHIWKVKLARTRQLCSVTSLVNIIIKYNNTVALSVMPEHASLSNLDFCIKLHLK